MDTTGPVTVGPILAVKMPSAVLVISQSTKEKLALVVCFVYEINGLKMGLAPTRRTF